MPKFIPLPGPLFELHVVPYKDPACGSPTEYHQIIAVPIACFQVTHNGRLATVPLGTERPGDVVGFVYEGRLVDPNGSAIAVMGRAYGTDGITLIEDVIRDLAVGELGLERSKIIVDDAIPGLE